MASEKLQRIQALENEVKNLHPVLNELFPRLPQISAVEYRQGSREMGADFVLEKRDETLLSVEYVGVIVKTGKIKQDHQEIDRQIEECELERTFSSGKKKIVLTELWVISNDTISQGAQDKIHHKYKNKSIKFIGGERLVQLLDTFFPEYWTDVTVSVGNYLRKVDEAASLLTVGANLLGHLGSGIYIEQQLVEVRNKKFRALLPREKQKLTSLQAALKGQRFVIVESGMGSGKSTLLAKSARDMTDPANFNESRIIPALITARELKERYSGTIGELIVSIKQSVDVEIKGVRVFIDGWDELHMSVDDQANLLTSIRQSVDDPSVTIVLASRQLAPELEPIVERDYQRYSLVPFSIKQVVSLVDAICNSDEIKARLLKDLEKSGLFKVLPKTPISAILLAKLLRENVQEIPSTMTELYGKYMELVMGRWDMGKGLQSQTEYEVINNVSISLAELVINNSLDSFSIGDARHAFDGYVKSRNLKIDHEATFKKMLNKSDLLLVSHDLSLVSFRHRTFAEYLYAVGLERSGGISINKTILDSYWSTIYFFCFGIKKDAEGLVNELGNLMAVGLDERFAKLVIMPNMLLAAYLTPYSCISDAVRKYFDEAVSLYLDAISEENSKSPLQKLSHLQLLCLITRIISSAHSYEFFKEALKTAAEDIYSKPGLNQERDMAELFLINSALIQLGSDHAYDTLIANYGPSIPLPLRIGVVGHSEEFDSKSEALEKYAKRVHKSIRGNRGMQETVKLLANKPISDSFK